MSEPGALGMSLRTSGILAVFTVIFTALMSLTYNATKDTIALSVEEERMRLVGQVLPAETYDNRLLDDFLTIVPRAELGLTTPGRVFRARKGADDTALVLESAAPDGYGGAIALIVAVGADGRLVGVRVTHHHETPGLGDYIDPRKDRNKSRPWITQFNGLGFGDVAAEHWKLKKDGGHFDYTTGATISARAVTQAVARALSFVAANREGLYGAPAASQF